MAHCYLVRHREQQVIAFHKHFVAKNYNFCSESQAIWIETQFYAKPLCGKYFLSDWRFTPPHFYVYLSIFPLVIKIVCTKSAGENTMTMYCTQRKSLRKWHWKPMLMTIMISYKFDTPTGSAKQSQVETIKSENQYYNHIQKYLLERIENSVKATTQYKRCALKGKGHTLLKAILTIMGVINATSAHNHMHTCACVCVCVH